MMKKVKLSELAINGGPKVRKKPFPARHLLGREEKSAVDALFDKAIRTGEAFGYNGPVEEAYCAEFAQFMGGGFVDAVNSGTNAIYVSLRALGPEPFTEVIVSPITDPGGMMPIVMMNCIPVIADSEPNSYNTGPKQVEKLITNLTSAILIAHIGGEPVDMEGIMRIARKRQIPVVEDCAQSPGAKLNGELVGTFGNIAAFSTMFGKHFCTGGQGGLVYTKDEKLYLQARHISDRGKPFGLPDGSSNCLASLNFNLGDLASAIGRVQLKKLPKIIKRRRKIVAEIAEGFRDLEAVSIPPKVPGAEPSYWFLRLQLHPEKVDVDKNTFCKALIAEGVPINPSYRSLPHMSEWYEKRRVFGKTGLPWSSPLYKGAPDRQFPCGNALASTEVQFNLGIHESWEEKEISDTIKAFKKVESAYVK